MIHQNRGLRIGRAFSWGWTPSAGITHESEEAGASGSETFQRGRASYMAAAEQHRNQDVMDRDDNSCLRNKKYTRFSLLAIGILLTACATGRIRDGMYTDESKRFAVELPSEAWNVETNNEADLVLRHKYRQAGILINATCGEVPSQRTLEIVSRHLFFGIRGKQILQQDQYTAAQGEALEVVLRGELGGREFLLHGYTFKGRGCVYDLVLFAPPKEYSELNGEFEALVQRFKLFRGETR